MKRKTGLQVMESGAELLLAICFLLASTSAQADKVYATPFDGPLYYVSKDLTPVHVLFKHQNAATPTATLQLPRAYVHYAASYSSKVAKKIPARITTETLKVGVWLPTGEPYSVALERMSGRQFVDIDTALRGLATVNLQFVTRDRARAIRQEVRRRSAAPQPSFENLKGVKIYPRSGTINYYSDADDFPFIDIECNEKAGPRTTCTYTYSVCPVMVARAQFDDFRIHGGLPFAKAQINRLKPVISSWTKDCK